MMSFIRKPNLPEGRVKTLISGTDDGNILAFFEDKGITVIKNASNLKVDSAVSTHADMAAIHLGGSRIIVDRGQKLLSEELTGLGMTVYESRSFVEGDYPKDVSLNFALVGGRMIGKISLADEMLRENACNLERLDVKQGYCKCSVLVVNENAIITDDEGIYRKASENGIEALLVSKGDIALDGHPYGFIGGASGKISDNTVVFFGDIEKHRDFDRMSEFLRLHGCNFECTDTGGLRDIGGILPIIEEV